MDTCMAARRHILRYGATLLEPFDANQLVTTVDGYLCHPVVPKAMKGAADYQVVKQAFGWDVSLHAHNGWVACLHSSPGQPPAPSLYGVVHGRH